MFFFFSIIVSEFFAESLVIKSKFKSHDIKFYNSIIREAYRSRLDLDILGV